MNDRRNFIKTGAVSGIGIAAFPSFLMRKDISEGRRAGIIGLDTSHSIAFTKALNDPDAADSFKDYRVVAAYPYGSLDIKSSVERIDGYTRQVKEMGVEIVNSVEELLKKVDVVLLETNDGRRHLEQAIPVIKAGKRMFIDKPMTASLADAMIIFDAAEKYKVPLFSSSSLRYIEGIDEIKSSDAGKITGAETFSPATIEETHPDLFWYGIHGVEMLFTVMGTGCRNVSRAFTPGADVVTGVWDDNRIGTFRGIREGKGGYGGRVYTEKKIKDLGPYKGYNPLLIEIINFFETGRIPVKPEETLEILAFMEAADISKEKNGNPVSMAEVMYAAQKRSGERTGEFE
jgi:hypothetical protein